MNFLRVTLLTFSMLFLNQITYSAIIYRSATTDDISQILQLIDQEVVLDKDKIVILPERFRKMALEKSIEQQRMFVATDQAGTIVGYKKIFLVSDMSEKKSILNDEIRYMIDSSGCCFYGIITPDGYFQGSQEIPNPLPDLSQNSIIYNGGDFTAKQYRNQGINSALTAFALNELFSKLLPNQIVTMVYGITQANAGNFPGDTSDRTSNIAKTFAKTVQNRQGNQTPIAFFHTRHRAFMPTFDSKATELQPLPDSESVAGFGCTLTYPAKRISHE